MVRILRINFKHGFRLGSNRIASWHLAFRAVAARPLKQTLLVGQHHHFQHVGPGGGGGTAPDCIYPPGDLNNLTSLEMGRGGLGGMNGLNTSLEDVKKKSLMSVFYLIILQMTGTCKHAQETH